MKKYSKIENITIRTDDVIVFSMSDGSEVIADKCRQFSKIRVMLQKIEDAIQEFNDNEYWY